MLSTFPFLSVTLHADSLVAVSVLTPPQRAAGVVRKNIARPLVSRLALSLWQCYLKFIHSLEQVDGRSRPELHSSFVCGVKRCFITYQPSHLIDGPGMPIPQTWTTSLPLMAGYRFEVYYLAGQPSIHDM